jgi:hypothetical protein
MTDNPAPDPQYIVTDRHMAPSLSEEHANELIEKYGHVESTVSIDMDDFDPTAEPDVSIRPTWLDGKGF